MDKEKKAKIFLRLVNLGIAHPNLPIKTFIPKFLKKNVGVVLAAVKESGLALEYADESLRKDKEFLLAAVKENPYAILYAASSLIETDPEIAFIYKNRNVLIIIYATPEKFLDLPTEIFNHKDFIDVAIGVVKNSLKRSVAKVKNVSDDYVESVKSLLNSIENKANKEFKQIEEEKIEREKLIQLEKEQEEVRRKEEDEKSLRMKENKEKAIELIEGFNLETKTAVKTDDGRSS